MSDAIETIELVFAMRDLIRKCHKAAFSNSHVIERFAVVTYLEVDCLEVDLTDIMHNGLMQGCNCAKLEPGKAFHGTKNLTKLLTSRAVMEDARNPLTKPRKNRKKPAEYYEGWYHAPDFSRACRYARPVLLGSGEFRPVCKFQVGCRNKCARKNWWHYTISKCPNYALESIIFFPQKHWTSGDAGSA